jgi:hypothetical protein
MKNIILLISILYSMASVAAPVNCDVTINGNVIVSGAQNIPQTEGEPEGAGALLLASEGSLKIYVTTYPIVLYANYFAGEVVVESKHSNILRTGLSGFKKATLNTTIDGIKIKAVCIED